MRRDGSGTRWPGWTMRRTASNSGTGGHWSGRWMYLWRTHWSVWMWGYASIRMYSPVVVFSLWNIIVAAIIIYACIDISWILNPNIITCVKPIVTNVTFISESAGVIRLLPFNCRSTYPSGFPCMKTIIISDNRSALADFIPGIVTGGIVPSIYIIIISWSWIAARVPPWTGLSIGISV